MTAIEDLTYKAAAILLLLAALAGVVWATLLPVLGILWIAERCLP